MGRRTRQGPVDYGNGRTSVPVPDLLIRPPRVPGQTHGTFHSVRWRRSAPDPVGRCRFRKTRVPASVADTHASLAVGVVRGAPEVLSKIEFDRMPVTLVIAVEPERGQIL